MFHNFRVISSSEQSLEDILYDYVRYCYTLTFFSDWVLECKHGNLFLMRT